MDKKIAGLLGAAAALTAMQSAQATATAANETAEAANYRDLLEPVPNALTALKADDARIAARATESQPVQTAQVIIRGPYRYRRYYHHHHHHHHHHHR